MQAPLPDNVGGVMDGKKCDRFRLQVAGYEKEPHQPLFSRQTGTRNLLPKLLGADPEHKRVRDPGQAEEA